jgi:hypothetical protein
MTYRTFTGIIYDVRGEFSLVLESIGETTELFIEINGEQILLGTINTDELLKAVIHINYDKKNAN